MDRLEEWRVFVTVAQAKSFVLAARSLGRSPQAATRAVAALETRLGTRLLHRTTRSVSLTTDGERYVERGRRALAELDLLEDPSFAMGGNGGDANAKQPLRLRGIVSITAPVLFGQIHIVPVLAEILREHRDLDARLVLLDRVVSLAEEGIDVAVRIGALADSSLRVRLVGHVRSVLCASPAYLAARKAPRTIASLATDAHDCIAFTVTTPIPDRWSFRSSSEKRERSVRIKPRLIVNTGQAAIEAALANVGIVRVISYQVDRLVAEGKLRILLPSLEPDPIPVHLVQLAGAQTRVVATTFMDLAAERLRAKLTTSK